MVDLSITLSSVIFSNVSSFSSVEAMLTFLKYFMGFGAIKNSIVFRFSFSNCLLLVYRNTIDFVSYDLILTFFSGRV